MVIYRISVVDYIILYRYFFVSLFSLMIPLLLL